MEQADPPFSSPSYPVPSKSMLQEMFVGKQVKQIPTPAVVLDLAVVERNCTQMLETCKALEVDFRPHMKTHKVRSLFDNDGGIFGFLISSCCRVCIFILFSGLCLVTSTVSM